jgi:ABC-type bacteriocin/lantibiotic exporter with double-glycine peptidase domain
VIPSARRPRRLALLACLLASGCYLGSARSTTPAELVGEGGWEVIEAIPDIRQIDREDCGAAALAMVLNYWGRPITRDEITLASPPAPDRGLRAALLRDIAVRQGLQAFLIQGQPGDLEREIHRRHPVLVGMMKRYFFRNYPHYEVVVGINRQKQRVLTLDPAHGLRVNGSDAFATEWAKAGRLTLVIFPQIAALKVVANPDK